MRYYVKLKASLHNPANKCITSRDENLLRNNQQSSFVISTSDIIRKYELPRFIIKPDFSYLLQNCTIPKYAVPIPIINKTLAELPKSTTNQSVYRARFWELLYRHYTGLIQYTGYHTTYTDGSKSNDGVGAAALSQRRRALHRSL